MAKAKLKIGDNVYANFERSNGDIDVRYGVVSDIKGGLVAVDWEIETLESSMYYKHEYVHLRERERLMTKKFLVVSGKDNPSWKRIVTNDGQAITGWSRDNVQAQADKLNTLFEAQEQRIAELEAKLKKLES